jgi:hypothetical protein
MSVINEIELHKYSPFGAGFNSHLLSGNQLRLIDLDGLSREITKVKIGRDFVSGLLEDNKTELCIRKNFLKSLEFQISSDPNLPDIHWSRKAMGEQLASFSYPASACIRYAEQTGARARFVVLGCIRSLLVTDFYQNPVIPVAAISYLELAVDNG